MEAEHSAIFILSSHALSNELLLYVLQKEVCSSTLIVEDLHDVALKGLAARKNGSEEDEQKILAINGRELDYERVATELSATLNRDRQRFLPVLYDLETGTGLEQSAIRRGVRGFFYRQDGLELLLKGFRAVFHGEIWVSREALVRSVLEGAGDVAGTGPRNEKARLTSREVEILLMVSAGANNTEIADKLCISPHTVKTHLYNVFQKIGVPNRLQAALWAARHL